MKALYLLDGSFAQAEPFVRREIREMGRRGWALRIMHRHDGGWQLEEDPERPGRAGGGADSRGAPHVPRPGWTGLLRAFAGSPRGALRARAHAGGPGAGLGSGLRLAAAAAATGRAERIDLIHSHFADRACEDAMLVSMLTGIPFTFTTHGYDVYLRPPSDMADRARAASAVIAVSDDTAGILVERHGVPRAKIRVIPCGVDTSRFVPASDPDPRLVVSVLRLHPDKGPDRLVEAAVLLAERGVEFRLEIVGEGAMRSGLESRILAGGARLAERVRLIGRADEDGVLAVLRRAAVFVLPSRTEAAPVALMEAMSCGLACVASDVGGVGAMLDGGRCGVLVPAGDPQAMAGAIAGLLADPARRRTLGAAARDRALRHYRLEAAADALAAVWSRAVEEARAR